MSVGVDCPLLTGPLHGGLEYSDGPEARIQSAEAGTVVATYSTGKEVPVSSSEFTATGNGVNSIAYVLNPKLISCEIFKFISGDIS